VYIVLVNTDEREHFNEKLSNALLFTSIFNIRVFTVLSALEENLVFANALLLVLFQYLMSLSKRELVRGRPH
jgi:hypothetical protein